MKANRIERKNHLGLAILLTVLALAAVGVGIRWGCRSLAQVYQEPCLLRDLSTQVEITSGKMVHPETIAEEFGLKVGRNLATLDFKKKREEILAKIPNLRSISVTRQLPDKVVIVAEERTPVARLGLRGVKKATGRVVDTEGVVFLCQRGTQLLPIILEDQAPGVRPGKKISGRILAALRLIEACREPDFQEFGVLAVDTSKRDFLVMTLGNYSKVKILWNEMDEPSARSHQDLMTRLRNLRNAIRSHVTPETVIWNATMPNEIYADTQRKLL